MKLQHLSIGASFEYEGRVYVKTGPLTAASEEGGSRIIPRYAVLKAIGSGAPASADGAVRMLDRTVVLAAFDDFHGVCASLVGEVEQKNLAIARQRFMAAIGS